MVHARMAYWNIFLEQQEDTSVQVNQLPAQLTHLAGITNSKAIIWTEPHDFFASKKMKLLFLSTP